MTIQRQIYEGIEIFKAQLKKDPKRLVLSPEAKVLVAKEIDPRAVDVRVACGLEVFVKEGKGFFYELHP